MVVGYSKDLKIRKGMLCFTSLFMSTNPSDFSDILQGFVPKVSQSMNEKLTKEVTTEEVIEAVFAIKASSGPGADGMTGLFFQKYWSIIGN